ncbi:MAG: alpha/beta hydrolase [Desulfobacterales bacterium]|jgi:alpha/beta superfamily hydrolase|nr:alpha/beta hydrolase [Desulfobacterales bacterium]
MEKLTSFSSGGLTIEALLERIPGDRGVVITHPHPLYGGDMFNPVVKAISNSYRDKEYSTLRINFRGVGKSGGKYENGIGEQEDVLSAVSYMNELGISRTDLAGYSFGTFVNIGAVRKCPPVQKMIMVSPPVAFMEFGPPSPVPCLKLVITGSRDEIAPAESVKKNLLQWNPESALEVIEGADHFYTGYLKKLEEILSPHL